MKTASFFLTLYTIFSAMQASADVGRVLCENSPDLLTLRTDVSSGYVPASFIVTSAGTQRLFETREPVLRAGSNLNLDFYFVGVTLRSKAALYLGKLDIATRTSQAVLISDLPDNYQTGAAIGVLENLGLGHQSFAYDPSTQTVAVLSADNTSYLLKRDGVETTISTTAANLQGGMNPVLSPGSEFLKLDVYDYAAGALRTKIISTRTQQVQGLPGEAGHDQANLQFIGNNILIWADYSKADSNLNRVMSLREASLQEISQGQFHELKKWNLTATSPKPAWALKLKHNDVLCLAEVVETIADEPDADGIFTRGVLKNGHIAFSEMSLTGALIKTETAPYSDELFTISQSARIGHQFLQNPTFFQGDLVLSLGTAGGIATLNLTDKTFSSHAVLGSSYQCLKPQVVPEGSN